MNIREDNFYMKQFPWMNEDHLDCLQMLSDIYCGMHHVHGKIYEAGPRGICINVTHHTFATFDFSTLTTAVFMAHDRAIRFEISDSGPRMLKLFLHKRNKREGLMHERHPTIEESLKVYRKSWTGSNHYSAKQDKGN